MGGAGREIIRASNDDFRTKAGEAIRLKGYHDKVGPFDMVLQSVYGTTSMIDAAGGDTPLKDTHSRRISVTYGIVLRGHHPDEPFTQAQLDAAFEKVKPEFVRFWDNKRQWETKASSSFDLPAPEGAPLTITHVDSPNLPKPAPHVTAEAAAPAVEKETMAAAEKAIPPTAPHTIPSGLAQAAEGGGRAWIFGAVAAVALGATYLAYKHWAKPKSRKDGFAETIARERQQQQSQSSHTGR